MRHGLIGNVQKPVIKYDGLYLTLFRKKHATKMSSEFYKQKCRKERLHFEHLKRLILSVENTEKYIAKKNGHLRKHEKSQLPFN